MSESEIPTKVPRCHPAAHIWCCCKAACLCTSKGCSNPVQSCPVQPRKISPHFGVIFATTLPKPLFFSEIPREKGKKNTKNHGEQTGRHPQSSRVSRSFRILHGFEVANGQTFLEGSAGLRPGSGTGAKDKDH